MTDDRDDEMLRSQSKRREKTQTWQIKIVRGWEIFSKLRQWQQGAGKTLQTFFANSVVPERESGGETMLIQQRVERLCREQMLATR